MTDAVSLTLNEAGYVVGQSRTAINRAVDRGVIRARLQGGGKNRLRKIGSAELRYLAIASQVEKDLTPAARKKVYEAVRRLPVGTNRLDLGVMELKLADVDRRISERLDRLRQVKSLVDEHGGGEPVLRGTAIPVNALAGLAKGQTVAEIVEDYPSLTPAQIDAAVEYAQIYPRTGRPLPLRSLKRMLAEAAAAGLWDAGDGAEPVEPQLIA